MIINVRETFDYKIYIVIGQVALEHGLRACSIV